MKLAGNWRECKRILKGSEVKSASVPERNRALHHEKYTAHHPVCSVFLPAYAAVSAQETLHSASDCVCFSTRCCLCQDTIDSVHRPASIHRCNPHHRRPLLQPMSIGEASLAAKSISASRSCVFPWASFQKGIAAGPPSNRLELQCPACGHWHARYADH